VVTADHSGVVGPRREVALSDDPSHVGVAARWAVQALSAAGPQPGAGAARRFVRAFLDKHPEGIAALLQRWRAAGPFRVRSYAPVAHKAWVYLLGPSGLRYTLSVVVDTTGLVRILDLQPEIVIPELRTWADLDAALTMPGVDYSVLVTRADRGQALHETAAGRLLPSGSAFKLYVLWALAAAIDDGRVSWDDTVTVRPELRSLPSGDMQDMPDGTRVSVRETAFRMIAISDNTAADLIINLIGRAEIERAVVSAGHQDPAAMRPFLSSREVFEIGWGDRALLPSWTAAGEKGRRELLTTLGRPLTARVPFMIAPVHQFGVDWFMSARDVCRVLVKLWDYAAREPAGTMRWILTTYPGVAVDRRHWPASTFKGGSNPGVMMFSWLLEDPRGVPYVVVLQQSSLNPELVRDHLPLRGLGERVINSLLWRYVT
jgi:hypothetical protein